MPTSMSRSKNMQSRDRGAVDPAKPRFMREPLIRGSFPHVYLVAAYQIQSGGVDINTIVERTEHKRWLISFADIQRVKSQGGPRISGTWMEAALASKCSVFLDSGAFTFQGFKLKGTSGRVRKQAIQDLFIPEEDRNGFQEAYITYCQREGFRFDCYANFDYDTDPRIVYRMQESLEARNIYPFPVVHFADGSLPWFRKYLDLGYLFIGISRGIRRKDREGGLRFFEKIFQIAKVYPKVCLHGFGITDINLALRFPWYSIDSSTWIKATALGNIFVLVNSKLEMIHITTRAAGNHSSFDPGWKVQVEKRGFDYDLMRQHTDDKALNRRAWAERGIYNVHMLSNLYQSGIQIEKGEKKWISLIGG